MILKTKWILLLLFFSAFLMLTFCQQASYSDADNKTIYIQPGNELIQISEYVF